MDFARLTTQSPVWTPILGTYLGLLSFRISLLLGPQDTYQLLSSCRKVRDPPYDTADLKILNSNQANFHLDRWQALLKDVATHGNLFSQAAFADERKRSYDNSRATNPVSQLQ